MKDKGQLAFGDSRRPQNSVQLRKRLRGRDEEIGGHGGERTHPPHGKTTKRTNQLLTNTAIRIVVHCIRRDSGRNESTELFSEDSSRGIKIIKTPNNFNKDDEYKLPDVRKRKSIH